MGYKEYRSNIVKNLVEECDKSKISNRTLGIYIRALHICAPLNILLAFLYISKSLYIIIFILLLIALVLFYYFNGCILTMLERDLCGDNFTFIDPFIEAYDMEMNNRNRYIVSIRVAIGYILLCLLIFYIRFGIK